MSVLDELAGLSSAEDFFRALDVPFDEAIVRVARLHILRRMGQYLAAGEFDGLADAEIRELYRGYLEQAYSDFVRSSPIEERLFKVHKEAVEPKPEPTKPFVPLAALATPGGKQ